LYDQFGNMTDWWTESSSKTFMEKAKCMVDQYSNYTVYGKNVS